VRCDLRTVGLECGDRPDVVGVVVAADDSRDVIDRDTSVIEELGELVGVGEGPGSTMIDRGPRMTTSTQLGNGRATTVNQSGADVLTTAPGIL
jgi:hypothetical protein